MVEFVFACGRSSPALPVCDACRVHVHPRPFSVNRVLRYFSQELEYLRSTVVLPRISAIVQDAAAPGGVCILPPEVLRVAVHCADADVVVEVVDEGGVRALRIKHRAGAFPTTSDFFVLVYNDPFLASLAEIWQVVVHATMKYACVCRCIAWYIGCVWLAA
jgi:hypothetical protein